MNRSFTHDNSRLAGAQYGWISPIDLIASRFSQPLRAAAALTLLLVILLAGCSNSTDPPDDINVQWREVPLLSIDKYMFVDNSGLDRIQLDVNGFRFDLVADSSVADTMQRDYLMPRDGDLTYDIDALLVADPDNSLRFRQFGAAGATAEIIVSDQLLPGQAVNQTVQP